MLEITLFLSVCRCAMHCVKFRCIGLSVGLVSFAGPVYRYGGAPHPMPLFGASVYPIIGALRIVGVP